MAEFYIGTESGKSKKKLLLIVVAIVAVVLVAVGVLTAARSNKVSEDEASFHARLFIFRIRARRYNDAYDMVKNNQFSKQEFNDYMINANKTVQLGACKLDDSSAASVAVMRCPFSSGDANQSLTITFNVIKQDDRPVIESFSLSE